MEVPKTSPAPARSLRRYLFIALVTLGTLASAGSIAHAQSNVDDLVDEIRQMVAETLGPERQGAAYAAMVNFAVHPDISRAVYRVDSEGQNADEPEIKVTKLPLRLLPDVELAGVRPFFEVSLGYQTIDFAFETAPGERIDSEWKAYGGSLVGGLQIPVGSDWTLVSTVNLGLARLKNNADFDGPISEAILKPATEGLVFNWQAETWIAGAAVAADYVKTLGATDLGVHASLSYNYVESYDSDSGLIDFNSDATTFVINAEAIHPTPLAIGDYPLAVVPSFGYTTFLGNDRDALGFEYFVEGGLALEADVSAKGWRVKKLRLGAKAIYGADVTGYGLIIGYRF